jgi:hypothetical protein
MATLQEFGNLSIIDLIKSNVGSKCVAIRIRSGVDFGLVWEGWNEWAVDWMGGVEWMGWTQERERKRADLPSEGLRDGKE